MTEFRYLRGMILSCWNTLCELAPWLLLGMLLSGALHVLLPDGFIRRRFQGLGGIFKAVALGVPLPLCSCGVIPAGIGLKKQGAGDGASVGFLISTPQTGIDSVLVSASFFGWPFAIFKVITAAVTGVVGGWFAEKAEAPDPLAIVSVSEGPADGGHHHESQFENRLAQLVEHAIAVFRSIWGWLIIGVLVSAVIEQFTPDGWLQTVGAWGLLPAMLLMLLISTPLYVCATASVPIAAALVRGGLPPAAALVFLMAGPATNVTTIGAIHQHFGRRPLFAYLGSILAGSMLGAFVFDRWLPSSVSEGVAGHDHHHHAWWAIASAILVLCLIVWFVAEDVLRRFKSSK